MPVPILQEERLRQLENLDKLRRAKNPINIPPGMVIYIEDARQDKLIPVTVLYPFEAVSEESFLMLKSIKGKADRNDKQNWIYCKGLGRKPLNPPFPSIISKHKAAFYLIIIMGGMSGWDGIIAAMEERRYHGKRIF